MIQGTVVYFTAYDICYDIQREALKSVLGSPLVPFTLEPNRRNPASLLKEGVWVANLPPFSIQTPGGMAAAACQVKVFAMGALSLTLRVPFSVEKMGDLVAYHEPSIHQRSIHEHAHEVASSVFADLKPILLQPVQALLADEAYTLFFLDAAALSERDTLEWFRRERANIGALLTQESDPEALSVEELEESTGRHISYYRDDLAVVDWDAALVVERGHHLEEVIYPIELANVQLAELESYDRLLEAAVSRSYTDVRQRRASAALQELEAVRIDMARMGELLENTGKLYGDWHLARLHRLAAERFHLDDWFRTAERKREALDHIHSAIKGDRNQRVMVVLEVMVVALFVIDIIIILYEGKVIP
ncbi:MAG: hypothetical protein J0L75_17035 [Spirochaetes bacterium]|nr:hypothetical protein [Spirochaetota bacterium]